MSDEIGNAPLQKGEWRFPVTGNAAKSPIKTGASRMSAIDRTLVAALPIFAGFSRKDIDDILESARPARFAKNANVFEQGGKADLFFLLLHGRVRAYRLTPAGEQVVIRFIAPGELFGVAMAIGRDAYPATADAVVDSVVLAWPSSAWPDLLARHPTLAVHTMQTLGGRLQESQTRVMEMSTQKVEGRIANALLRLLNQAGRETGEGILIDFPISRQDIAQMTGTTLYTVSRIMSAWEDLGVISTGRRKVVVRDPGQLSRLAESAEKSGS
jgi:CRP/FNR family transcriptional regulator, nitrogen oxide reductase regulator